MRILLAEDDDTTRRMISEWLTKLGHQVILAKDGLEGIVAFNDHTPELVITDCLMPQVCGRTLTQHVKNRNGNIPVIMLTAFSERFSRAEAERIWANEYLQKPVTMSQLQQAIEVHDRYC